MSDSNPKSFERLPFREGKPMYPADQRSAHALEFIAGALERIERHLSAPHPSQSKNQE